MMRMKNGWLRALRCEHFYRLQLLWECQSVEMMIAGQELWRHRRCFAKGEDRQQMARDCVDEGGDCFVPDA